MRALQSQIAARRIAHAELDAEQSADACADMVLASVADEWVERAFDDEARRAMRKAAAGMCSLSKS